MSFQNNFGQCNKCGEQFTGAYDSEFEWCKSCHINNIKKILQNWTSGNEIIDNFIKEMQLKIDSSYEVIFEWIPYNQFKNIKEINKDNFSIIYSAIWEDGPLDFYFDDDDYYNDNSDGDGEDNDNSDDDGEDNDNSDGDGGDNDNYHDNDDDYYYNDNDNGDNGEDNDNDHGSDDNNDHDNNDHGNNDDNVSDNSKNEYTRDQNTKVALKCLYNSPNIDEFLSEIKKYSIKKYDAKLKIYGISQNPDTKDYIMVLYDEYCEKCGKQYTSTMFKWCKPCQINDLKDNFTNWTSGNEKIDNLIQEMQLKINKHRDIIFEWIPYSQFNDIKEISKDGSDTIYSAIWKDGSLNYDIFINKYIRNQNEVNLKYFQNITDEFLNEVKVKVYSVIFTNGFLSPLYGMSQNPDTKDYIIVFQDIYCKKCGEKYTNNKYKNWCKLCQMKDLKDQNWISGNENIDNLVQEMQSKINEPDDVLFEWISYNQFNNIKEVSKNDFATVYSAIWKYGPLVYNYSKTKYKRNKNKEVTLKCLYNSQNITEEIKAYSIKQYDNKLKIYGISQNADTKNYIIVFQDIYCKKCDQYTANMYDKWCKSCQINYLKNNFKNWTSGNENIDKLIQEMQLKIDGPSDLVLEWISYSQFSDIKEIGKGGFAKIYSAFWKDGPFEYDDTVNKYTRGSNKKIALKCLYNSNNITNEFLNEVRSYSIKNFGSIDNILTIYGISQNPDTKDYIIVLDYAEGGSLYDWIIKNYNDISWLYNIKALSIIIKGLKKIHEKQLFHHDFHTGNILLLNAGLIAYNDGIYISDMGLCGELGNTDEENIYGVMPYVAPEVLRGNPYTQAADIYSFGMIMYFMATGRQPFANCEHDQNLALDICEGIRPKIKEPEAPECYIDLMKRCWDSNPVNRPNAIEIDELIDLYYYSYSHDESDFKRVIKIEKKQQHYEFEKQFKKAEEYRASHLSSFEKSKQLTTHAQAIYTSRLLSPFTKDLNNCTDCLDCEVTD